MMTSTSTRGLSGAGKWRKSSVTLLLLGINLWKLIA